MAALPTLAQIAGSHTTAYEAFYQQVDPAGINHVGALEAAAFLKRSGLADSILSKIWDLADAGGRGFLDKRGFFVALKLVALVQSGRAPSLAHLALPVAPPSMMDQIGASSVDWSVKPLEQTKYVEMFNSLGPVAGKLPGSKVKPVMLNSKLPVDVLGKIWDLSDVDQDGALSEEEFIVAMHLVYKALDNCPIPSVLPAGLVPRSRPLPDSGRSTPSSVGLPDTQQQRWPKDATAWVVGPSERAQFEQLFASLDTDMDGLVTGADVKGTFLKTGLPQADLAHIWNLCDSQQKGSLNGEQFALAMHLAAERAKGLPLPTVLAPDMVPPSLRLPAAAAPCLESVEAARSTPPLQSSGSRELELATEEMKSLQTDKLALEQDIVQAEADLKSKSSELRTLEAEMEAVTAMLKQLDSQKKEAHKRLADLASQVCALKKQLEEQSQQLEAQERELAAKRAELRTLCEEELELEAQIERGRAQLSSLAQAQQESQLQASQARAKQLALEEQQVQLRTWVSQLDRALQAGDPGLLPEAALRHPVDAGATAEYQPLSSNTECSSPTSFVSAPDEETKDDPFKSKDVFNEMNGFLGDPFAGEDPFKAVDPFKGSEDPFAGDPFKNAEAKDDDYFAANFQDVPEIPIAGDAKDPFDPFGTGAAAFGSAKPASGEGGTAVADPFGTDPFAPVVAPRAESPTPALPPKKGKQPPPRPAPPKHLASAGAGRAAGPTRAAPAPPPPPPEDHEDPFASKGGGTAEESFANFADFGNC